MYYILSSMPIVQTWIHNDDYIKYLAIHTSGKGAWSEHVRNSLNPPVKMDGILKPIKTPIGWEVTSQKLGYSDEDSKPYDLPKDLKKVIKTPKDAEKAVTDLRKDYVDKAAIKMGEVGDHTLSGVSIKLCKIHGTPLTQNGKCLQKGCKYS